MSIMRRMIPGQRLLRSPMLPKLWDFRDPFFDLTHSFQGLHERDLQEFGKLNAMDVIERKDDIQVELEVPGLKKENLDLVVKDDTITITGKVEEQDLKDDEKVWAKERYSKEFSRFLKFGRKIDPAKMSASLENGILKITVPKEDVQEDAGTKVDIDEK